MVLSRGDEFDSNLIVWTTLIVWATPEPFVFAYALGQPRGGRGNEQKRDTEVRETEAARDETGPTRSDHGKSALLNSLRSPESQRGYRHAIDEFIEWYCSEPRLSFDRIVTRYRIFLEDRQVAPGAINGRLAAVRRLAYEAADAGLLSPELAAGIRRVKGVKQLGVRVGNPFQTG